MPLLIGSDIISLISKTWDFFILLYAILFVCCVCNCDGNDLADKCKCQRPQDMIVLYPSAHFLSSGPEAFHTD